LWQFVQRLNREGHTVILTTHYLEEAETLCGRIAMLKQGRVVALDTTSNLLARFSRHALSVRLAVGSVLPEILRSRASEHEGGWQFRLTGYHEVEEILAALREDGCVLDDLRLTQADLEDVFVGVMQGDDTGQRGGVDSKLLVATQ
jgi:ABC-2 type transport system ATP-binding protein